MGLFSSALTNQINQIAAKSNEAAEASVAVNTRSMNDELNVMSKKVMDYFKDSPAILITSKEQLHDYIDKCIENGYAGIDTETTGLDRIHDHIVGASLYTPGLPECYIPMKHLVPIFDTLYKNQLTYEEVGEEFARFIGKVKLIFANADFDLAMIYKDLKVDLIPAFYYDVITAWRCLREDEKDNSLKGLYAKYVKKGKIDPQKFSDFFSPKLFPNCKPQVAALYAANDAKITYELFLWQLPYVTKSNEKCKKHHLEKIADLIWNIEFPLVAVCAHLHRRGVFLDDSIATPLHERYTAALHKDEAELAQLVQELIDTKDIATNRNRPFRTGADFNPNSNPHVKYLINNLLGSTAKTTSKDVLKEINKPATKAILKVRGDVKLLSTYVDKLPKSTGPDHRVHARFNALGADTGRMCIAEGTMITVLNGVKKIEDIVPGDLVYCYDDEGMLQLSKVKNLWKTGENRECVTIKWQSSGSGDIGYLTCTPEHNILKKDGTWCEAQDLKRYDKLAHLRRTLGRKNEPRPDLYGWNGLATREQDVVKYSIFHADSSMHIHHKDGDCSNNELSNLEILSSAQHASVHGKQNAKNGTLKYDHLHDPKVVQHRVEVMHSNYVEKVKKERDILIQAIHSVNGVLSKVPYDFDSFKHRCKIAGVDYEEECRKAGGLAYKYRKAKDVTEEEFKNAFEANQGDYQQVSASLNISQYTFYQKCKEYSIPLNHMVQSVKPAGRFDVYDIEVETYHNFIANEICVHNSSSDPNLQNIPSHAPDIRHLFRATPEQDETVDLTKHIDQNTDSKIAKVRLNKYSKVRTDEGLISLKDVSVGQRIYFKLDSNNLDATTVEEFSIDKGEAILAFATYSDIGSSAKLEIKNPAYVVMNSDFSQQEPRLTAAVSSDKTLIDAFNNGRDVYATISSIALHFPYEECLEFNPITGELQPEGKERRSAGKVLNLGITYGMSVQSISESLFGTRDDMTDEQKLKEAQKIQDSLLKGFPGVARAINDAQHKATTLGYTETILGRRRHHPNMQLPRFEFEPMDGYVNPDIDPLDPKSLENKEQIPKRLVDSLTKEFNSLKWYGKIVKRTKELAEQKIKVINNSYKIEEASRQCFNSIIQGSAADLTKMAMLRLEHDSEWAELGGRMINCIHDEIMCEVPIENVDKGAEVLSRCMCEAGDFLPFKLSCDVEKTFRWYGLSVEDIMNREKPSSLDWDKLSESNIEWLQCMIVENEYLLPVLPEKDGSKPQGIRASGVNGVITDELKQAIQSYMERYQLKSSQEFLDHIEAKVIRGVY